MHHCISAQYEIKPLYQINRCMQIFPYASIWSHMAEKMARMYWCDKDTLGVCVLGENAHLNRNDMDAKITPIKPRQSTICPGSNLVISKATKISSRSNQLVSSLSFPNIRKRFDQVKFEGLFLNKGRINLDSIFFAMEQNLEIFSARIINKKLLLSYLLSYVVWQNVVLM